MTDTEALTSAERSESYYDTFSQTYERQRHHGYHVLLDELEMTVAQEFCSGRILEAGCGTGLILQRLQQLSPTAPVGADLSHGMLELAHKRGLLTAQASVDALPFPSDHFDAVVSFKVLAHVPDIEAALQELVRVTRPGGHLVLEFYNRRSIRALIKRLKRPTHIGQQYNDEDVYTRFDSLKQIESYLPADAELVTTRGVRVFTPVAQIHDVPLVGQLVAQAERAALRLPLVRDMAGFLCVVLRKRAHETH